MEPLHDNSVADVCIIEVCDNTYNYLVLLRTYQLGVLRLAFQRKVDNFEIHLSGRFTLHKIYGNFHTLVQFRTLYTKTQTFIP